MKIRKSSNYVFLILAIIMAIAGITYSYHLSNNINKRTPPNRKVWLIGKGAYFEDSIRATYNHLVTDFPLVEISGQLENIIIVQGYEQSKKYLDYIVSTDTLFVRNALPESDTIPVTVDGDYPILITVGANSLRSITVEKSGRIDIPVNPYGSNPGEQVVFKDADWEKYVLRKKEIDLNFYESSNSEFFLEVEKVNINIKNTIEQIEQPIYSNYRNMIKINGTARKVSLVSPAGTVHIDGSQFTTDSLIVKSNPDPSSFDSGEIIINCTHYLEADLLYDMDVKISGTPVMKKREKDFGRVIIIN